MTRSQRPRALRNQLSLALLLTVGTAHAQPRAALGGDALTESLALVLLLALVGVLPFLFMTVTAFVKISTVLQIVRGAIGAQNIPSNMVVLALSTALTVLAMSPVGARVIERAEPVVTQSPNAVELVSGLFQATREPLRAFLKANASERERQRFFEIARQARKDEARLAVGKDDLIVVIPAFVVSELIEAFALGFAIYLPFLIIDLVVGNVLLALGMQMMTPTQVSLPFKLLLFVAVDGWGLLAQALVLSYQPG